MLSYICINKPDSCAEQGLQFLQRLIRVWNLRALLPAIRGASAALYYNELRPHLEIWHDGQVSRLHGTVLETGALLVEPPS